MKIPIIFLGTSQAIPTAKRNHTAILLSYGSENILIDCGEGTQRQFRKAGINPCKLTKILITHWHGDHVLGLPGLLQTLALNKYNKTLEIYLPKGTKQFIELIFRLFIFKGKIKYEIHECQEGKIFETSKLQESKILDSSQNSGRILKSKDFDSHQKSNKIFENKDFILQAAKMNHGTPCLAYSFTEKSKIRINKPALLKLGIKGKIISQLVQGKNIKYKGKIIKANQLTYLQAGRKISFIFDTSLNENCYKIAKNSDLLICESTYTQKEADLAARYHHLTAKQAATIAKKSKAKKLILTHISQRYEHKEKFILAEAKKVFKQVSIAEDLDRVEI